MTRRQHGERRSIHNPQSLDPNDLRMRINDRHRVVNLAHPTRTRGVPILVRALHDVLQDTLVARDIRARHVLWSDQNGLHGLRVEETSGSFEGLHGELAVRWVRELIGVHERKVSGGVGCDVDVASG